jgi:putative addiction module component (TIGR02574 family)
MRDVDQLTQDALALPHDQRAELAERLLNSLDSVSEEEAERLWTEEALRRVAAYEAGQIDAHSAQAVHEAIFKRFE